MGQFIYLARFHISAIHLNFFLYFWLRWVFTSARAFL